MVSFTSLAILVASASLPQVLGVNTGSIVAPPARNQVGPALVAACGQSFANYLAANPGATALELDAQVPSSFKSTCTYTACGYYQAADSASHALTIKPRDTISVISTVNGLPPYPVPSDHHSGYTEVNLVSSTGSTGLSLTTDYATGTRNITVGNFWGWNFIYGPDYIPFPIGTCATGCSISWEIQQGYWKKSLVYSQPIYTQCVDFNIDWNGFQP